MATTDQKHPANTVFLLLEDRSFRFEVIKPGLVKEKHRLGKLVTGKHQVRGFRNISKAPVSMIIPAVSEEVNVSPELAQVLLQHWYDENSALKEKLASKLVALGYEPKKKPFDDDGNTQWLVMKLEHAEAQYDGTFLEDENENAVMLMSLLLGWFGTDDEEPEETEEKATAPAKDKSKPAKPKTSAKKTTGKASATANAKAKPTKKAEPKKAASKAKAKVAGTTKPKAAGKAKAKAAGTTKPKAAGKTKTGPKKAPGR